MKNLSLKSLVFGAISLAATVSVNAGNGTQTSPYTVCATSGFKLTTPAIPGATYQWFDASNQVLQNSNSNIYEVVAANVSTTFYKVKVTNAEGCSSDVSTFYVISMPVIDFSASANAPAFCANNSQTITLTATPSAVTLPTGVTYQYAWTGSTGTGTINNSAAAVATSASPTTANVNPYIYTATMSYTGLDVPGCSASNTVNINVNAAPSAPSATISGL